MPPVRITLAATCALLIAAATAAPALADPPWSVPAPVPGVANGPATATPSGNVLAVTDANRTQPPGTASLLLRIGAGDG